MPFNGYLIGPLMVMNSCDRDVEDDNGNGNGNGNGIGNGMVGRCGVV